MTFFDIMLVLKSRKHRLAKIVSFKTCSKCRCPPL